MNTLKLNSKGPEVELLQSTLLKLGFYSGLIDGIFGYQTYNAVTRFQKEFGLSVDGIVGPKTWDKLMPYINGYTSYKIKEGDTISSIAKSFNTTENAIFTANPNIEENNLKIDTNIIVPFGNIIPTNINYTSQILNLNINSLQIIYPFLKIGSIGNSVLFRPIKYIKFGSGKKEILYIGSTHANEWITTPLLMKFIEQLSKAYTNNFPIFGVNPKELFNNVSLYIIPMLNPDGVDLVTGYLNEDSRSFQNAKRIASNFPDLEFPSAWKSNIEGIDLNLQFPASWEKAKEIKYAQGYNRPAPRDFVGYGPLTAPEAVHLYNFTLMHNFSIMLTYHTQGRVIYYQFEDITPPNSENIAKEFSRLSGYSLTPVNEESSYAGFKDWFIKQYNRPGFTIEAGIGTNPLPISQFPSIYHENLGILISALLQNF